MNKKYRIVIMLQSYDSNHSGYANVDYKSLLETDDRAKAQSWLYTFYDLMVAFVAFARNLLD